MATRKPTVRVLLVGGPMYDGLYDRLAAASERLGIAVEVQARLAHPALNAEVARRFSQAPDDPGVDLISTHTKYAPSQAAHLRPLDDLLDRDERDGLLPLVRELATIEGRLVQMPRHLDVQLLYARRSLFSDAAAAEQFARSYKRGLELPATWQDLFEVATFLSAPGRAGFLFPGRDSGLFGLFYELLVSAGGELFGPDLSAAFDSPAGRYALEWMVDLHHRRRITPAELPTWHYDEVTAAFGRGEAAMIADWPGADHLHRSRQGQDDVALAPLPCGFTGRRAAYAGCHSFAITRAAADVPAAVAILRELTSTEARLDEAARGAFPVTHAALQAAEAAAQEDPRARHRLTLLREQARDALIIPPRFARYPVCEDALWRALQSALVGDVPVGTALERAAQAVATVARQERPA